MAVGHPEARPATELERWSTLQVRHLAAFVAVAETGSLRAAGRRLGYSRSGIGHQLASLERIVAHRLLIRHPGGRRPVELTAGGVVMLEHAQAVLARLRTGYAEVRGLDPSAARARCAAAGAS